MIGGSKVGEKQGSLVVMALETWPRYNQIYRGFGNVVKKKQWMKHFKEQVSRRSAKSKGTRDCRKEGLERDERASETWKSFEFLSINLDKGS